MATRKPRMAAHQDRKFRPVISTAPRIAIGDDTALRQADAAAWSAISGLPMDLYRGIFTYIPLPADLQAQMRQAAAELTAMPSRDRAEALLRLAHVAAYGPDAAPPVFHGKAGGPLESPRKAAGGVSGEWWDAVAGEGERPSAAPVSRPEGLAAFADESRAALAASDWPPEDGGEVPRAQPAPQNQEWWD